MIINRIKPFTLTFMASLTLHALILAVFVYCHIFHSSTRSEPVFIDLSLLCIQEVTEPHVDRIQPLKPKFNKGSLKKPFHKNKPTNESLNESLPQTLSDITNNNADTIKSSNLLLATSSSSPSFSTASIVSEPEKHIQPSAEEVIKKYEAAHFKYIYDLIRKHTVYPAIAEEMGISGTVVLRFKVNGDGAVGDIQLICSSGSKVLDRDALATVKRSGPFPKPPIPVTLHFPIQYTIE